MKSRRSLRHLKVVNTQTLSILTRSRRCFASRNLWTNGLLPILSLLIPVCHGYVTKLGWVKCIITRIENQRNGNPEANHSSCCFPGYSMILFALCATPLFPAALFLFSLPSPPVIFGLPLWATKVIFFTQYILIFTHSSYGHLTGPPLCYGLSLPAWYRQHQWVMHSLIRALTLI